MAEGSGSGPNERFRVPAREPIIFEGEFRSACWHAMVAELRSGMSMVAGRLTGPARRGLMALTRPRTVA